MTFVLRMAVREIRASWRRLLFFFLCLSLGVAAIVTLRSVIQIVRETLTGQARTMLGADVTLSTNRAWTPDTLKRIEADLSGAPVSARLEEIETLSMVRPADVSKAVARMAELRGVEPGFPLYGRVELLNGQPYSHALLKGHGALAKPELLAQLGIGVGDAILIGDTRFTVRGVLTLEPGRRAGAFSFGSRVLIDLQDLRGTGLLGFGGRASYRILLRVPDQAAQALATRLGNDLRGRFVSVRSFRSSEDHVGEEMARTENYLSLIGLVIVILGGVGVWSVVRVFIAQKIRSVAVLKCVGATTRQILAIYVAQVLAMGIAGSVLGVVLAAATVRSLAPVVGRLTGVTAAYGLTTPAMLQGLGIGLLVSLLFAIVPLLDVRHVRPSLLLRASTGARLRVDWIRVATVASVGAMLVVIASWQAASWRIGLILSIGLAVAALLLNGAGWLLVRTLVPLQHARVFALRQAARRVTRPGNQTRAVLLAVGLGTFFIVGVRSLQTSLLADFDQELRPDTPDMFLIDIQPDQVGPLRQFLATEDGARGREVRLIPVLRARVTGVKGRNVNLDSYEDVRGRHELGREFVITYRPQLERNERVVEGAWWPPGPGGTPEVSIEQGLRDRAGLHLGDTVRFDILGRTISARVTSVRSVEWSDTRAGGFMFVFRPGALEGAPQTFIAPLQGPPDSAARARLQRDLSDRFSNVSIIDVREILTTVQRVLSTVALGVSVVGGLVLFSGMLILVGSISMTKFQRVYEAAVLKTLGASTRVVGAMLLLEYALLGVVAGTIGSGGALGLSWAVSRYGLKMPWHPSPLEHVLAVAICGVTVAAVGLAASVDVLRRRPLATLRAE